MTAVPFWGETVQISCSLPPKRDCSPKRVNAKSGLNAPKATGLLAKYLVQYEYFFFYFRTLFFEPCNVITSAVNTIISGRISGLMLFKLRGLAVCPGYVYCCCIDVLLWIRPASYVEYLVFWDSIKQYCGYGRCRSVSGFCLYVEYFVFRGSIQQY